MNNPFKKDAEANLDSTNAETIETEEQVAKEEEAMQETTEEEVKNEWQDKYEILNNQYIRLAADFDNYRKRQAQEREDLLKYGAENTVKKLIEVMDNFDRGIKAIETVEDCEKVKECYMLAYKNFNDVMTKIGLEQIKSEGEIFDPNFHEAVMQTPTAEADENTIIVELQKGYKLGDKVLRPALVNVATSAE